VQRAAVGPEVEAVLFFDAFQHLPRQPCTATPEASHVRGVDVGVDRHAGVVEALGEHPAPLGPLVLAQGGDHDVGPSPLGSNRAAREGSLDRRPVEVGDLVVPRTEPDRRGRAAVAEQGAEDQRLVVGEKTGGDGR
jgi:hypothetical protein